ncbi:hypothetical protein BDR07DRAFT_1491972 [Suillus spraguei]|nr:hypothetical protein BDR07DRAFT_1491972 [Suillus spraguei]
MYQVLLTPTEKAAVMRAAKLKSKNQQSVDASACPVQQAKTDALKNQVWMTEKNPCKRAASNIAEADGPKQARVLIGQRKSKAPLSAAQLFDSDSDDVKPDESDDSSSDLNSGGVDLSDNKLEESDDDIVALDSKKLKATLEYERPQIAPHGNGMRINLFHLASS